MEENGCFSPLKFSRLQINEPITSSNFTLMGILFLSFDIHRYIPSFDLKALPTSVTGANL
jgi:hypothetical protein